ncbi:FLAVONOID 3'-MONOOXYGENASE-RELATED [Salix purpurea]|uniref:FLAVONOID 3'-MONOOXYGENASE-RELATED n=1 Tax=Salix purpurea TaxID=77065 RepID=A0A9Q0W6A8_SALPP|nr:FLAVONOID 3'-MONOOXYGENASE-RELATED [Salix purpurea]
MLDDFQALLGGFSLGDYFPSMEFVHSLTGMKSKLQRTFRQFDQFFDEVITEHQNSKGGKEEKKDLVDVLLDIQRAGSSEMPLTMDNIKAVILVSEHLIGLAVTFNFNAPNIKLLVD